MYISGTRKSYRVFEQGDLCGMCSAQGDRGTSNCIMFIAATGNPDKCAFRKPYGCDWNQLYEDRIKEWNRKGHS